MNSKKLKKMLALLLAASMCLSVCACGENGDEQKDNPAQGSEANAGTSEQEETALNYWEMLNDVADTSELPDWTGETLEINVWVAGGTEANLGTIADTNVTYKEFERVTGVKFNVEESFGNNGDSIDAVLPKLLASKDFPNLVFGWDIGAQLRELYDNGYLADLTEYYDNGDLEHVLYWMPMEYFDAIEYDEARTEEGQYYLIPSGIRAVSYYNVFGMDIEEYDADYYNMYGAVPRSATSATSGNCVWVREDVLQALYPDALSMEDIEQIYIDNGTFTEEQIYDVPLNSGEDFVEFLRDIKELLESGEYTALNGKTMEVTYGPHSETDNWGWMYYLPQLVNGFGNETDYFVAFDRTASDESSVLTRAIELDQYKDWMQTLNTLVNEDVISQNSLVDNSATFTEKMTNGHYAVWYGDNSPTYAWNVDSGEAGWKYRPVWVNTPIDDSFGATSAGGTEKYLGIFKDTLTDEQLDQLVHAIDYLYSTVGVNNFMWGPATAGLFEEDAEGNRTYTDKDVEALVMNGEDNGSTVKYGIIIDKGEEFTFNLKLGQPAQTLLSSKYLTKGSMERLVTDARVYYNPGILAGKSMNENVLRVNKDAHAYSYGQNFEGMQNFWSARAGFEDQMKKVMAATTDNFENAYQELIQFCEENSLTAENIQEFNDGFVEANHDALVEAGIIK